MRRRLYYTLSEFRREAMGTVPLNGSRYPALPPDADLFAIQEAIYAWL